MLDSISYYSTIRMLHLIGMAAWFGTAITVSVIWSKRQVEDKDIVLELITKIEMPASFFVPLTGVLMMIDQPKWLLNGWLYIKILIGFIAIIFSHMSRAKLIHQDINNDGVKEKLSFNRNLCLLALTVVIIYVGYK